MIGRVLPVAAVESPRAVRHAPADDSRFGAALSDAERGADLEGPGVARPSPRPKKSGRPTRLAGGGSGPETAVSIGQRVRPAAIFSEGVSPGNRRLELETGRAASPLAPSANPTPSLPPEGHPAEGHPAEGTAATAAPESTVTATTTPAPAAAATPAGASPPPAPAATSAGSVALAAANGAAQLVAVGLGTETPAVATHAVAALGTETHAVAALGAETLGAETLGAETLGAETLGAETLSMETHGGEVPGAEEPGAERPSLEPRGRPSSHAARAARVEAGHVTVRGGPAAPSDPTGDASADADHAPPRDPDRDATPVVDLSLPPVDFTLPPPRSASQGVPSEGPGVVPDADGLVHLPRSLEVRVDDPDGAWNLGVHRQRDTIDLTVRASPDLHRLLREAEPELRRQFVADGTPLGQMSLEQGGEAPHRPVEVAPVVIRPRRGGLVEASAPTPRRPGQLLDRDV